MQASYYTDPFAGSDDAMCYAEIDMDEADQASSTSFASPTAANTNATTGTKATAAGRGGALAMQQLRRQLEQSQSAQQAIRLQYEETIAQMRLVLLDLQDENGQLRASQSDLEATISQLQLEKENLDWTVSQERDRAAALQSRISALETECDVARGRAQSVMEQLNGMAKKQQQSSMSQRLPASPCGISQDKSSTSSHATDTSHSCSAVRVVETSVSQAADACIGVGASSASVPSLESAVHHRIGDTHVDTAAGGGGSIIRSANNIHNSTNSCHAMDEMTELEKEQMRGRERVEVERLESELLQHSRARDRLEGELGRLESVRSRTMAQRRRRAVVESDLAHEEQRIGQVKLQLRAMAALTR